jgi:hypothetical protein
VVVLVALSDELFLEEPFQVVVVRRLLVLETSAILHVTEQFLGKTLAELFQSGLFLDFSDLFPALLGRKVATRLVPGQFSL